MKKIEIFGILNITPDSFSDGGQFMEAEKALRQAKKLCTEGADFIDIGGESTRPHAPAVSPDQEWARIATVVQNLVKKYPGKISLDTQNFCTAKKFLELGGTIINDVSGFQDPRMISLAAQHQTLCIVNHFPGKNTDEVHEQEISSPSQVADELLARKEQMIREGVLAKNIILDPGIGFGKTMVLNKELLKFGELLPTEKILIGHSRKRFLGENRFKDAVNQKAGKIAIEHGASFLRVHEPGLYS